MQEETHIKRPHYNIVGIDGNPMEYYVGYMAEFEHQGVIYDGKIVGVNRDLYSKIGNVFVINVGIREFTLSPENVMIYKEKTIKVFI